VGGQLAEVAPQHQRMTRRQAATRAVDRLRAVRIPDPEWRYRQFPHELSGGMRQRAMIGMAVMGSPALVIADEPTTALAERVLAAPAHDYTRELLAAGPRPGSVLTAED
jgi:ABC-type dipeptide/oligopeptide/nickel transport system ATPase component